MQFLLNKFEWLCFGAVLSKLYRTLVLRRKTGINYQFSFRVWQLQKNLLTLSLVINLSFYPFKLSVYPKTESFG